MIIISMILITYHVPFLVLLSVGRPSAAREPLSRRLLGPHSPFQFVMIMMMMTCHHDDNDDDNHEDNHEDNDEDSEEETLLMT